MSQGHSSTKDVIVLVNQDYQMTDSIVVVNQRDLLS